MMNRVVFQSISLRSIIVCILLTSFPFISYATMIQMSEEEGLIAKRIANNLVDKKQLPASPLAKKRRYSYLHTDLLTPPADTRDNTTKKQHATFFEVDVKKTGKIWGVENLENEPMLIQESLHAFKKTKQFYHKTDKILADLTQDLLRTLKLEQLNKLKPRPITEVQQNLYRSIKSNSAHKTSNLSTDTEFENTFFGVYKQLVRVETVFYLLAFLFIYSILKWLIRQLLIPKY